MPPVAPFIPDRFASAVPFYREHRLRYPARLIGEVARRMLPGGVGRVLDLGCGPGFLAIDFAALGCSVLGLDPDLSMLEAARQEAHLASVNVEFRQGSSYDLSSDLGLFDLVVMGRSFHWMDRAAALGTLDALLETNGAVVLFGDEHERTVENHWYEVVRATMDEFAGPGSFSHRRRGADWVGHVATLLDSVFSDVERYSVWERRGLTLPDILGRALSMSGTAPEALGERRAAFEAVLSEKLAPFSTEGRYTEVVEFYAIMARRPH